MAEPGYNTGVSAYPAEIDQRVTQTSGNDIKSENQNYLIDADIKIQETLGVNPHAASGSVANRLDTGTFPELNIAGTATISGALTLLDGTRPVLILRDDSATTDAEAATGIRIERAGSVLLGNLGFNSTSNTAMTLANQITNGNLELMTSGTGSVIVDTSNLVVNNLASFAGNATFTSGLTALAGTRPVLVLRDDSATTSALAVAAMQVQRADGTPLAEFGFQSTTNTTFTSENLTGGDMRYTTTGNFIFDTAMMSVIGTRPSLDMRDSSAANDTDVVAGYTISRTGTPLANFGFNSTTTTTVDLFNLKTDGNIRLRTTGIGYVLCGFPSGQASPANGDFNAVRLFSNGGSPITCYPFEAAYGTFDQAEWDRLTLPDGLTGERSEHAPAKRFAARNDLDIVEYCASLKARKALPNFPTKEEWQVLGKIELGDLCQRLTEAVETLAIHLASAHEDLASLQDRVAALEAARSQ